LEGFGDDDVQDNNSLGDGCRGGETASTAPDDDTNNNNSNKVINNMYSHCRVFVKDELVCPHNQKYPLGNFSSGKRISCDTTSVKKRKGTCGQTTPIHPKNSTSYSTRDLPMYEAHKHKQQQARAYVQHTSHITKSFLRQGGMPWQEGKMKPFLFVFGCNNLQPI
jgi:hypothetical protein